MLLAGIHQTGGGAMGEGLEGRARRRLLQAAVVLAAIALAAPFAARFWRYTQRYPHTRFQAASLAPGAPGRFYLDWRAALPGSGTLEPSLAPDGIFRGGRDLPDGRHDALRVIQASLALHDQLLDRPDPERAVILRRQVEWLIAAAEIRADLPGPVWPHAYEFPRYGLAAPWVSALTQGQAISLLVRAAAFFGEPRYAELAGQAAAALLDERLPFVHRDDRGRFLEEFPCDPPAHALNGCLLAWLGLWDWARATGDPRLGENCREILAEISRRVPDYDLGGWTRYDRLQRRPTSPAYHELHAALAEALAAVTGEAAWAERAVRWRAGARSPWRRAWVGLQVLYAKASDLARGNAAAPRGRGWS